MPIETHVISSEHLNDDREIYVYLPDGWEEAEEGLPVLYMQDGQRLFSEGICEGPCWEVDASVEALYEAGLIDCPLIVGVANGEWRDDEYTPSYDGDEEAGGEADRYLAFLLDEVKPFIDARYPVRPQREHTAIGGSSLGGLLAIYAAMEHPELFGMVAAFSPSLWWDEHLLLEMAEDWDLEPGQLRIWIDMGWLEQDEEEAEAGLAHPVEETDRLHEILLEKGLEPGIDLAYEVDPEGSHDEASWGRRFADALIFLYGATPPA